MSAISTKIKNQNNSILDAVSSVYKQSEHAGLNQELIKSLDKELKIVSKYLKCSKEEAFIFSNFITMNLFGDVIDMIEVFRFFKITPFDIVPYMPALNELIEKKLVIKKRVRRRSDDAMRRYQYTIPSEIIDALMNQKPLPKRKQENLVDQFEVIGKMYDVIADCIDDSLEPEEMQAELEEIHKTNRDFPLIDHLFKMDITETDRVIFLFVIWKSMNGAIYVDIDDPINSIFSSASRKVKYLQGIYSRDNRLIKQEWVEYSQGRFYNDMELSITDKTSELLKTHGINILKPKAKNNTIKPETIAGKELFYENEEKAQISKVQNMMQVETYGELMKRLSNKGLPQNMNILLFGAPGTGKTETVLQLAKISGREIMKVDISQSKSMWFGESEKLVKKIFSDYAQLKKDCALEPILFFNEADAILATRKDNTKGNVAQTENAIQNILLEELENFNGIFIATTNLAENLDKAFDRRFLFKIKFQKPNPAARASIWMSKLEKLNESDALQLAERFDLTGGQIDNIIRKVEIENLINDETITLEKLAEFCEQEIILQSRSGSRIGFGNAA
ncbi:MAG: ATP-binding protein [Crocinitomicaceae bacterium]